MKYLLFFLIGSSAFAGDAQLFRDSATSWQLEKAISGELLTKSDFPEDETLPYALQRAVSKDWSKEIIAAAVMGKIEKAKAGVAGLLKLAEIYRRAGGSDNIWMSVEVTRLAAEAVTAAPVLLPIDSPYLPKSKSDVAPTIKANSEALRKKVTVKLTKFSEESWMAL